MDDTLGEMRNRVFEKGWSDKDVQNYIDEKLSKPFTYEIGYA